MYGDGSRLPESFRHDFVHIIREAGGRDRPTGCAIWNTPLLRVEVSVATLGRRVGRGSYVLVGRSTLPGLCVGILDVVPPSLRCHHGALSSARQTRRGSTPL